MDQSRFQRRWRLGTKLVLAAAVIGVAAAAAAAIGAALTLRSRAWTERQARLPVLEILGRLEARRELVLALTAPGVRPGSALPSTIAAARDDVLEALALVGAKGSAVPAIDVQLAGLARDLQELQREAAAPDAAAARSRAEALQQQTARLRGTIGRVLTPPADASWALPALGLCGLAFAVALAALVLLSLSAGSRARALVRDTDAMTFAIRSGDPPPFPPAPRAGDEIAALSGSLAGLGRAVQNAAARTQQLASELDVAAGRDPLTSALSRQRFQEVLEEEISRSRRYGRTFSLILFDVDHLDRINEDQGSDTGDYVLATIANLVRYNVRKTDSVARWGGDEFALLLTETGLEGARYVASKLRRNIEIHAFDRAGTVTVSAGVTEVAKADTRDSVAGRADDAMHRAKRRGRNRVVATPAPVADPQEVPG